MMDKFAGRWRKASASNGSGDCVEVAMADDAVGIRDSKDPDGGHFELTPDEWRGLMAMIKRSAQ
jgi:hypothetical protein